MNSRILSGVLVLIICVTVNGWSFREFYNTVEFGIESFLEFLRIPYRNKKLMRTYPKVVTRAVTITTKTTKAEPKSTKPEHKSTKAEHKSTNAKKKTTKPTPTHATTRKTTEVVIPYMLKPKWQDIIQKLGIMPLPSFIEPLERDDIRNQGVAENMYEFYNDESFYE